MVLCEALKLREMAVTQHVVFNQAVPERLEEALCELCAALDEVSGSWVWGVALCILVYIVAITATTAVATH